MINKTHKTSAIGAAVFIVIGTMAAAAQAQTAEAQQLERIEITGSRIKRIDAETSQPVFSLNREALQATGLTSVGEMIQQISTNGSALNSSFNNGGNGESQVSLRNLGSGRTLVLVNGKRWVGGTGLGGAVDLNTIPTAAVERIDVLKDGASATYGSDAIAGVVNVILRKSFEGMEFNGYTGQYGKGDGKRQSVDLTIGGNSGKVRSVLGMAYVKEDALGAGDRDISAVPVVNTGVTFGSSTIPGGRFGLCKGTFSSVTGLCTGGESRPGGAAGQFTYDPGKVGNDWRAYSAKDNYNFAPDNYLVTPQERASVFGRVQYDISDKITASMMAVFNNRKSEQLLAAMPIVLGTGPGAGSIPKTIAISKDSMYNPFGLDVSRVQRRAVETGGRSYKQDVNTSGFNAGLEGSFTMLERDFSWDAGATYGRNSQQDTTKGLFNLLAMRSALGPSMLDGKGVPTCVSKAGDIATRVPDCVPMNLLGGVGSITPGMLGYTSFEAHDLRGSTMSQVYANMSGDLVKLPAGMASIALGVERRSESGYDRPDALIASGNTTGNARTATDGSYNVKEAFGELSIPLLKGLPFAKMIDLSVATRYSDYSNFGSTTNSKAGLRWQVVDSFMVRGNWGQGFRAPSISELYQGVSDSFPTLGDPCSTTNGGGYAKLTAEQKGRCHAQGVPVGGYDQGNSQIRISVGGNTNLKPESSTTKTLGVVFAPGFLTGFDVSLDWWKIDIKDGIETIGASTILDRCIKEGQAAFCSAFTRNPGGAINTLLSAGLNYATTKVEGYDMTINYRLPKTSFGTFGLVLDSTYMKDFTDSSGENRVGKYFNRDNYWRLRSNLNANWSYGDFGATWGARYFGAQTEDCSRLTGVGLDNLCSSPSTDTTDATNRIGAVVYHDVSASYRAPWKGTITLGVNNLFDKNPPISYSTANNSFDPQYMIPGRFLYVRYGQKF
ncbi:TonB-dependent receptor [Paucibacter sp. TC2R-5]|uniref:TonB-dependent receptor domain-containing protein n=1 Tax=Paucibacter sp. TC2R-5 TaxID=2893555 RepID=UPI0021E44E38|nr:TonB-dependent receptor [Paucibacter sp. TC2R-5]MCV2360683.1 TonB-dependent receptor [Paucibacter sp. TC2R-5]